MRKILLVGGNMLILVIMMLGVVIGMKLNLKKTLKVNGVLQIVLTGILIFIMGVSLGSRENFFNELAELGWKSVLYMLSAVAGSILIVYGLTKVFMKSKEDAEI
ncbi:hypothetical protein CLONEX_03178 [[Clostridium] nexile DSM 1787]|nr:hypothetical protein CLONEX_03178 [[Clostridium] nexile DSM 1787]